MALRTVAGIHMSRPVVSAVIFDKKGRVLSIGRNSYVKTHPIQAKYARKAGEPAKVYLHAEIDAIIKLRKPEDAYSIHVVRLDRLGTPSLAKPCRCCALAIRQVGIRRVTHT